MLFVVVLSPLAAVCQALPDDPPVIESESLWSAVGNPEIGPSQAASSQPSMPPTDVLIPQDTQVQLRLLEGLSTVTDHKGYVVHLEVTSDVVAGGVVVVPAGTQTTVKITHAGGRLEFSDPRLTVGGRKVRLSKLTAAERGELGAEEGAAIGIAIFAAPIIAVELPIVAVWGVAHAVHGRPGESKAHHYVFREKGEILRYYVRSRTQVNISSAIGLAAQPIAVP